MGLKVYQWNGTGASAFEKNKVHLVYWWSLTLHVAVCDDRYELEAL